MYTEASQEEQIQLISSVVPHFLIQYKLEQAKFENVNHGFNSSFKVTADNGQKYALRINTNSKKSASQVEAEVRLLELIEKNKLINAPVPVRTISRDAYSKAYIDFLGRDVTAVLSGWIDGDDLGDEISDDELFQLGASMAKLHLFSRNVPTELENIFPRIDRTLFNSPDNLRTADHRFDAEVQNLIEESFRVSEATFKEISKSNSPLLIHADLHPSNVLKTANGLSIIDFDDVGIGFEIQDLAITFFYLRDMPGKEDIVLDGYRSVCNLPEMKSDHLEALLVARQLLLLNDLLDVTTAEEIAYIPEYIEISRLRLKNYHKTGRFELIRRLS